MNTSTARPIPEAGQEWLHVNGGTMRVLSRRGNLVRFEWVRDGAVVDKGLITVHAFEASTVSKKVGDGGSN